LAAFHCVYGRAQEGRICATKGLAVAFAFRFDSQLSTINY
jgi:hypothetical protein